MRKRRILRRAVSFITAGAMALSMCLNLSGTDMSNVVNEVEAATTSSYTVTLASDNLLPEAGETVTYTATVKDDNGDEVTDLSSEGIYLWWYGSDSTASNWNSDAGLTYSNYDDNSGYSLTVDVTYENSGSYIIYAKLQDSSWADITLASVEVTVAESSTDVDTAVDANIYVEKISLDDDFITGVDVSSYISEINSGVTYYDFEGNALDEQGFFNLLYECGVNYVRIRVWNDPYDDSGNGYGGGNNDLAAAVTMGQYATNAGMKVLIDFHFSDFWADPGKQEAPKAWSDYTVDERANAISSYVTSSLTTLFDAGVDVGMVQIGNETTNGFCGSTTWSEMVQLFDAGCDAVHDFADTNSTEILAALHFTNPESGSYATYAATLDTYDVSYDVFASSYYPYWHGSLTNLESVLSEIADTYGKKVMVAETSWSYTYDDGDGHENTIVDDSDLDADNSYDISVQGQADEISSVIETIASIDNGIGVFYWEPAWIPVQVYEGTDDEKAAILAENKEIWETYGSGWASSYAGDYDSDAATWYGGSAVDNQAWFDFYGNPLDTLMIYSYVRTGTNAPLSITSITADAVTVEVGDTVALPETATITYNDGTTETATVTWNETELTEAVAAGIGTYTISGTVTATNEELAGTYDVTCTLTINPVNLLSNSGFEDGDDGVWTIEAEPDGCVGIKTESSNTRNGSYCLHFWDDEDFTYTVYQTVTLAAGTYTLSAYVQGGDNGTDDTFVLYALVGSDEYTASATLSGWQTWDNPEITNIVIDEETDVTVGVKVSASSGAWGSWEDFTLYAVESNDEDEPNTGADSTDDTTTDTKTETTTDTKTETTTETATETTTETSTEETSTETPAANDETTAADEDNKDTVIKKGDVYTVGNFIYKVTNASTNGKGKVKLTGVVKPKKNIKIPAKVTIKGYTFKVTAIGKAAFKNDTTIKKLTIGKNVTRIGKQAFYGCTSLKSLVIGKNVKLIKTKAFANCKKLDTIVIKGKKLKTIRKKAFDGIKASVSINVPNSLIKKYKKLLYKKGVNKTKANIF